jgi:hypothetical protein
MAIVHGRWNKDGKPQGGGGTMGQTWGNLIYFPQLICPQEGEQSNHRILCGQRGGRTYIERSEGNTFIFYSYFFTDTLIVGG